MAIRPIKTEANIGIFGILIALTAFLGFVMQWDQIINWLAPAGVWLNWRFVIALLMSSVFIVALIFHELWRRSYNRYARTRIDVENLMRQLDISEQKRMTDVITGVPNGSRLTEDILNFFNVKPVRFLANIVLIDIKNFRNINRNYGYLKGDEILRKIAQKIYNSMRRNEYMYQHPALTNPTKPRWKKIYRRYPGGDEFVFLLEGDQGDAMGFIVNRLYRAFQELTDECRKELNDASFKLSFHCALAPLSRNDTDIDALTKVEDCYMRAAEGDADYTICWSPEDYEHTLPDGSYVKKFYEKARRLFQVINIEE